MKRETAGISWCLLLAVGLALCGRGAAAVVTVRLPVAPPFSGGAVGAVDVNEDGGSDVSLRGEGACTADYPMSFCASGISITLPAGGQFLVSAAGSPTQVHPVEAGSLLGMLPESGVWAAPQFQSMSVTAVQSLLEPEFSGYTGDLNGREFLSVGWRIPDGADWRYGWVDFQLYVPFFSADGQVDFWMPEPRALAVHYADTAGEPVRVVPVPEVSGFSLLLAGALGLGFRRGR